MYATRAHLVQLKDVGVPFKARLVENLTLNLGAHLRPVAVTSLTVAVTAAVCGSRSGSGRRQFAVAVSVLQLLSIQRCPGASVADSRAHMPGRAPQRPQGTAHVWTDMCALIWKIGTWFRGRAFRATKPPARSLANTTQPKRPRPSSASCERGQGGR